MGDEASLRSHIWITGVWSSSEARQSCVATSGCHATTLVRILEAESLTLMMGSFFRRSQTTQRDEKVVARMCCTCLLVRFMNMVIILVMIHE